MHLFDFGPGLGTNSALYSAIRYINNYFDNEKKVMENFLNLTKPFNLINHKELTNILSNFGVILYGLSTFGLLILLLGE